MRTFSRIAVFALLLVLPFLGFAQSQSSSTATAASSGMAERMSQLIGEKVMFTGGQQAGTVKDVVMGDKGDFSYIVIEFNSDVIGAAIGTPNDQASGGGAGATTGTTQTPSGSTGANTSKGGKTAESQTPTGASNSSGQTGQTGTSTTAGTNAANSPQAGNTATPANPNTTFNRFLVPVNDVTFDVTNKTLSISLKPVDIMQLQPIVGDQLPATLGVGSAMGAGMAGGSSSTAPAASQSTSGTTSTQSSTSVSNPGTGAGNGSSNAANAGTNGSNTQAQANAQSGTSNANNNNAQTGSAGTSSSTNGTSSQTNQGSTGTTTPGMGRTGASSTLPPSASMSSTFFLGSKLPSFALVDSQGKDIGKVTDAMLDLGSHQILYFGFGSGGFLGIGEKVVAIPLSDVSSWDLANQKIMLSLSSDDLKNLQPIDKNSWPAMAPAGAAPSSSGASSSSSSSNNSNGNTGTGAGNGSSNPSNGTSGSSSGSSSSSGGGY